MRGEVIHEGIKNQIINYDEFYNFFELDEETKKWISSLDTNIPPSKDLEKSSSIDEILSFARNDDDLTSVIFSLKKMRKEEKHTNRNEVADGNS